MLEKQIEERLRLSVKCLGGIAYKWVSPGNAGVPDRIVVLPGGLLWFVELKQPGKKPTTLQRAKIDQLRRLGFRVKVIDSVQGVDRFIREVSSGL